MTEALPQEDDFYEGDEEFDAFTEALDSCHGYFDQMGSRGRFMCGAVGSEDCDECPCNAWLGLTNRQIDALEDSDG